MKRKLTTIFCADVSGYSRMMGADEARTLATLKEYREAIEGFIGRHHGRVVSWSGDGLLAEFASVVEAVQCAAEVQRELKARNASLDEDRRMTFRIGINLGDVMVDGEDIFGEGVNIAARLQQMAPAGGILISSPVYDQVRGKLSLTFDSLGSQTVKNIAGDVSVYAVTINGVTPQPGIQAARPSWGEDDKAAAPSIKTGTVKRGKLIRRGMALLVDYSLVAVACVTGALALNTLASPNAVQMDLEIPLLDYGDIIERTPWAVVETFTKDNARIREEERLVTYDYFGLFTQSYLQKRTRGMVHGDRAVQPRSGTPGTPGTAGAPGVPGTPGTPGTPPTPPPPPPAAPAPPAPPVPPVNIDVPGAPKVQIGGGKVVIDGEVIADIQDFPDLGRDERGWSIDAEHDTATGWRFSFSGITERLIDRTTGQPITRPSLDALFLVILALYFALMEMGRRGSTVGKNAFDLVVTREDGAPMGFGKALGRNIIKVLTTFIFPIALLVAWFSRRRQGIHDRIAGTVVVRET